MYSKSILARVFQPAAAVLCQTFLQENRLDAGRFKGCLTQLALTESCRRLNPGSAGADELIRAARRATTVDRSEIAIDGLRPEDNEVGSAGSLHKGMNAWRKKALFSFVPLS